MYTLPNNLFPCNFSNFTSNARNECPTWSHSDEHVPYICTRHSIFITAVAFSLLWAPKSLHQLVNHLLPCYLGTRKSKPTELTELDMDKTAGRSEQQILHSHWNWFLPAQPKRKVTCTEGLLRLQRALHVLNISVSCTPLVSRILNTQECQSWRAQCSSLKLNWHEELCTFRLLFALPNRRNQLKIH